MINQLVKFALATISLSFLSGCFDNTSDTDRLCSDNPELQCEFLNMDDGQCRIPRTDLVWHKHHVLLNPSDNNKIQEIAFVSAYRRCLELAAQIEPIDQRNRKANRVETMVYLGEEQERLVEAIKQSDSAEVLYFLWSQTGDDTARRRFLQREGKPEMETAELQYALATFYSSRNDKKTEQLLHHSLALSEPENVNVDIFKTLSSLYYRNHELDQAYVWSMVAKEYGVQIASDKELAYLYRDLQANTLIELDHLTETILKEIELGQYLSRSQSQ
ncbi:DUF2989 domain-containing protein [Vibrio sp. FNV 38]|nr:DUF2989 domain-containing protein [Vibrio sp. FNV 38]